MSQSNSSPSSISNSNVFIAPGARVVGNVTLGDDVSIWFNAVIRGDSDTITIGSRSNIQDCAVIHADPGFPTSIGEEVIVGHSAIIHGATIANNTLIGMRATLLNGAKVGSFCIIGAGSLLTEGTIIPDRSLVIGVPGKVIRSITPQEEEKIKKNAQAYVTLKDRYLRGEVPSLS